MDGERVDDRADGLGCGRAAFSATPVDVAELYGGVRDVARAAPDVLHSQLVGLYLDVDVGAHVLLVLRRVVPVALGVQRV